MIRMLSFTAAFLLAGTVHAQDKIYKWQRYAVGTQSIHLVFAAHINAECMSKGESRLAIIQPPKNGTLTSENVADYSSFTGTYAKCDDKKIDGLRVIFTAKPGFKGKDRLVFAVVYVDGDIRRYEVDMTVW